MAIPSIAHLLALEPVSPHERTLLEARLKEDDDDPEAEMPWADARAELRRER